MSENTVDHFVYGFFSFFRCNIFDLLAISTCSPVPSVFIGRNEIIQTFFRVWMGYCWNSWKEHELKMERTEWKTTMIRWKFWMGKEKKWNECHGVYAGTNLIFLAIENSNEFNFQIDVRSVGILVNLSGNFHTKNESNRNIHMGSSPFIPHTDG